MNTAHLNIYSQGLVEGAVLSYYCKFNGNTTDEINGLTPTTDTLTYEATTNGQAGVFNASNDLILNSSEAFKANDGVDDLPFSIIVYMKRDLNDNCYIYTSYPETLRFYCTSNLIRYIALSKGSYSNFFYGSYANPTALGTYFTSILTYGGTGSSGVKMYHDGVFKSHTPVNIGTFVGLNHVPNTSTFIGGRTGDSTWDLDGKINTFAFKQEELTPDEVVEIHNKLINGTGLI
ncbi:MAG: hypothetical protein HRT69_10910 [Flavobacteriaceae bacterium]|nr:hypothetical protein [Flavobacteriaceae bacterium]